MEHGLGNIIYSTKVRIFGQKRAVGAKELKNISNFDADFQNPIHSNEQFKGIPTKIFSHRSRM
ncbi:MAG: hypothetical protein ACI30R_00135 [Sodaliphilus sp.]